MPVTRRGRETRDALVRAARTVIAERGFLRTTVADIAKEAGRSPASFYNYFESKEALLEYLADGFRDEVIAKARTVYRRGTPVEVILRESARAYMTTYRDRNAEMVGVFQQAMIDDAFAKRWREIAAVGSLSLEETIRRAQRQGYCPGADPKLTASALGLMMEAFCYRSIGAGAHDSDRPFDEDAAVDAIASIWYRAIYWKPEPTTKRRA